MFGLKSTSRFLLHLLGRQRLTLYWITNDLAVSRAPRIEEWPEVLEAGISCVFDLRAEAATDPQVLERYNLAHIHVPIAEGAAPVDADLEALTQAVINAVENGRRVLLHCREGRGRSPLVACATLVRQGLPLPEAFRVLRTARPDVALSDDQALALQRYSANV
jgi:protein-tyrosine phosphatase